VTSSVCEVWFLKLDIAFGFISIKIGVFCSIFFSYTLIPQRNEPYYQKLRSGSLEGQAKHRVGHLYIEESSRFLAHVNFNIRFSAPTLTPASCGRYYFKSSTTPCTPSYLLTPVHDLRRPFQIPKLYAAGADLDFSTALHG
jgi:hypothetical protein